MCLCTDGGVVDNEWLLMDNYGYRCPWQRWVCLGLTCNVTDLFPVERGCARHGFGAWSATRRGETVSPSGRPDGEQGVPCGPTGGGLGHF